MDKIGYNIPLLMEVIMASITSTLLKTIIADQQSEQIIPKEYYHRGAEKKVLELAANEEIIVITGIRRCGKSVLLHKLREKATEKDYYFNFEDERLATFTADDFQLLYEVLIETFGEQKTFYFDEIQNIPGWEMFVRRLYNAGNKIFITGSNANLFSEELGTRLTGRYISLQMYPFSYYEHMQHEAPKVANKSILSTIDVGKMKKHFHHYCKLGGIPAYIKYQKKEYLHSLYDSIIYRDIIARYKLTNTAAIKKLVFFLASNCSKETTFNSLRKLLGLGSVTTVSDYCGYLENSYLCFFVNRYSTSIKAQQNSPKKVYFIDHALAKTVGFRFSEDQGRMLENIVFIELKRRGYVIFYHKEIKECDFIIQQNSTIRGAIQVCQTLKDPSTEKREINGLIEALEKHSLNKGLILTESEEGEFTVQKNERSFLVSVQPLWKWLMHDSEED